MPTSGQAVLHSLADAAGLDIDLDLSAVHEDAFTAAFSELGIPAAVYQSFCSTIWEQVAVQ